jgi:hypothetical protein
LRELVLRIDNITKNIKPKLPDGIVLSGDEFFINGKPIALSGEEKKLLRRLAAPIGGAAAGAPMVAKRLREKLNGVSSELDIITVRGKGYKLVVSGQLLVGLS